MYKVSIIIPVYNTGKYLRQCLDSVINQTLKDIEIICVNDGSTDDSHDILEEYAQKDTRIILINQKNKGQSAARNAGLNIAKGELITFLDSDDYIELNAYEKAIQNMTDAVDMVCFGVNVFGEDFIDIREDDQKYFKIRKVGHVNINQHLILSTDVATVNKIFTKEIIKKNKIQFSDGLIYEDALFYWQYVLLCKKAYFMKDKFYHYRRHNNSTMATTFKKTNKSLDHLLIMEVLYDYMQQHNLFDANIELFQKLFEKYLRHACNFSMDKDKKKVLQKATDIVMKRELKEIYPNWDLIDFLYTKKYTKIKGIDYPSFVQRMFSLKNQGHHKIIRTFGLKIKVKRKKNNESKEQFNLFTHQQIEPQTVLIVEANSCHGEVIPGYIKYFNDLGYKVDLLVLDTLMQENPFVAMPDNLINKLFIMSADDQELALQTDIIKKYDYMFITSNVVYYGERTEESPGIFDFYDNMSKPKKNTFVVEHHLERVNKINLSENCMVALAELNHGIKPAPVVINPHYFGDVKITPKNTFTNFIMVGAIEAERRNCDLLIKAIDELYNQGITNFKVTVIGRGSLENIPAHIQPFIDIKGRVKYKAMYEEMEKADYFLPLLDANNPEHDRYLTLGTSGSFQLIYGFLKPCLIHEKFAEMHGFDNKNSFIYSKNSELSTQMKEAIELSEVNYQTKQQCLTSYVNNLYEKSLNNLQQALKSPYNMNKETLNAR